MSNTNMNEMVDKYIGYMVDKNIEEARDMLIAAFKHPSDEGHDSEGLQQFTEAVLQKVKELDVTAKPEKKTEEAPKPTKES